MPQITMCKHAEQSNTSQMMSVDSHGLKPLLFCNCPFFVNWKSFSQAQATSSTGNRVRVRTRLVPVALLFSGFWKVIRNDITSLAVCAHLSASVNPVVSSRGPVTDAKSTQNLLRSASVNMGFELPKKPQNSSVAGTTAVVSFCLIFVLEVLCHQDLSNHSF